MGQNTLTDYAHALGRPTPFCFNTGLCLVCELHKLHNQTVLCDRMGMHNAIMANVSSIIYTFNSHVASARRMPTCAQQPALKVHHLLRAQAAHASANVQGNAAEPVVSKQQGEDDSPPLKTPITAPSQKKLLEAPGSDTEQAQPQVCERMSLCRCLC